MARQFQKSQQSRVDERQKAIKPVKKPESPGQSKVNPAIQRANLDQADPQTVLGLQQTVGNQAVSRMLNGPAAVQRDAFTQASDKDEFGAVTGAPTTAKTPPAPGTGIPMPYPNKAEALSGTDNTKVLTGPTVTKIGGSNMHTSHGDEPGTMGGITSNATIGPAITPSMSKVVVGGGASQQEDMMVTGSQTQVPEETEE